MSFSESPCLAAPPPGEGEGNTTPGALPDLLVAPRRKLYQGMDWLAFAISFFAALTVYCLTLAPEVTLSDSGVLAASAYFPGASRPPGYPLWEIYAWLFCKLLPFGNVAWRIGFSSAFAAAAASGLIALLVSCVSAPLLRGMESLKDLPVTIESRVRLWCGIAAGLLFAFSRGMWSKAVIVEMDSFRVLFLLLILATLLQWLFEPERMRYLCLAAFLFGAGVSTFQTLSLTVMGIAVAIALVRPKLGRDLLFAGSLMLFLLLCCRWTCILPEFSAYVIGTDMQKFIFCAIAITGVVGGQLLVIKTRGFFTEVKAVASLVASWMLGAVTYFLLPLFSMANPPVNWGYPRTAEGFWHTLCRGQYERCYAVDIFAEPARVLRQMASYYCDLGSDFAWIGALLALVPLVIVAARILRGGAGRPFRADGWFKTEEAWLIGSFGTLLGLSWLLNIFLNFAPDRQSLALVSRFFTPAKALVAILTGCGLAVVCGLLRARFATLKLAALVPGVVLLLPLYSLCVHWTTCSQNGHWFGYWFGHDIFTPPFQGKDGQPLYPEMAKNAVLYGGTDPGRFCPTYMIFCESFTPHACQPIKDQKFDRRDVYILTQNALADGTYLNSIRALYNRSKQIDPPFFQELLRTEKERQTDKTNLLARMASPLDRFSTNLGAKIEKQRRAAGVFPAKEIYIATPDDSQRCFSEYLADAQKRLKAQLLKPGEDVREDGGRVQMSGQVAVMSINGLLAKVMFDRNLEHEFYVEESFPLDWMYPHLTPFGIIMKINREPLPALSQGVLQRDHEFWKQYSKRLTGDIIDDATSVKQVCEWAEKTYLCRDFSGFTGDRKFVYDDEAQQAFSKLRSSIGGVYAWRLNSGIPPEFRPKTSEEYQRLIKEANYAFLQAFAYCPYSPEAVFRYINLLLQLGRLDDALLIAQTCLKLDPNNGQARGLLDNLITFKQQQAGAEQSRSHLRQLEQELLKNPTNFQAAFNLAATFLQIQQTNRAVQVFDNMLNQPTIDANAIIGIAKAYSQMGNTNKLENVLERLVKDMPTNPDAWFDLAALQAMMGKSTECLATLSQALNLSTKRLQNDPTARDLVKEALKDQRFNPLRAMPEFQKVLEHKP
ncbi:MAG: DUF2723 domain-containing protein [Verrucomicrobiota bacterium]